MNTAAKFIVAVLILAFAAPFIIVGFLYEIISASILFGKECFVKTVDGYGTAKLKKP